MNSWKYRRFWLPFMSRISKHASEDDAPGIYPSSCTKNYHACAKHQKRIVVIPFSDIPSSTSYTQVVLEEGTHAPPEEDASQ